MRTHLTLLALSAVPLRMTDAVTGGMFRETSDAASAPEGATDAHQEEGYKSLTVVLDHLVREPNSTAVNVKTVWSTDTADEALVNQHNYFADKGRAFTLSLDDMATIVRGYEDDVLYVYTPNADQTQVIGDVSVLGALKRSPVFNPEGTEMGLHMGLIALASDARKAATAEGKNPDLVVWVPTPGLI